MLTLYQVPVCIIHRSNPFIHLSSDWLPLPFAPCDVSHVEVSHDCSRPPEAVKCSGLAVLTSWPLAHSFPE